MANQPNDLQIDPGNDDSYNAMYKLGYGAGYLALPLSLRDMIDGSGAIDR